MDLLLLIHSNLDDQHASACCGDGHELFANHEKMCLVWFGSLLIQQHKHDSVSENHPYKWLSIHTGVNLAVQRPLLGRNLTIKSGVLMINKPIIFPCASFHQDKPFLSHALPRLLCLHSCGSLKTFSFTFSYRVRPSLTQPCPRLHGGPRYWPISELSRLSSQRGMKSFSNLSLSLSLNLCYLLLLSWSSEGQWR